MKIKFQALTLQCRKSREVIEFSPQITYIHGKISAGKSSIMRLVDYCLGGDLERTPAISQELVAVNLSAHIGSYDVLFERQAKSNQIQVSWKNDEGESGSVLAPIDAGAKSIWEEHIYNVSDLIFYLACFTPIKVRKSKRDENSALVRLSFRDIMWYCYLIQDHLDSSFYQLKDTFKGLKSRDAMRFITGAYTEKMNELQIEIDSVRNTRYAKAEAVQQLQAFLEEFGYALESDVAQEVNQINIVLQEVQEEQRILQEERRAQTHFADELRHKLRRLSSQLSQDEITLEDLQERISEQESLQAELLSAKFKLARSTSASSVLSGVSFESCPVCGADIKHTSPHLPGTCKLCGRFREEQPEQNIPQAEIVRRDLTTRIDDLSESITHYKGALKRQEDVVSKRQQEKARLDRQLSNELFNYDSSYFSRVREVEQRIATFEERKRGLEKIARMPEAITQFKNEALRLKEKEDQLKRELEAEKKKLTVSESYIQDIEHAYLEALLKVGVPGMSGSDTIEISRRTWMPMIIPEEGDPYNFYNAGSGGKKTLLNVCYGLAVHKVAAEHNLPLPTFLMIDTPMKNIGEDVDKDIFGNFYHYLYELAENSLSQIQFIIIDKEFFAPESDSDLEVIDKFMSPTKPLISYYRGH